MLKRIWAIAVNTLREALRNKLLYAVLFFSVLLIAAGVAVSTFSYVEGGRIMQDFGMATIRLLSAGVAVFFGIGLMHREIERRTIFTILSKPLRRSEFVVGKYLGLLLIAWTLLAGMAVPFAIVSWLAGTVLDGLHVAAFALAAVELAVIVALATFFISFTTPMLAALFTVSLYVIGHLTSNLYRLAQQADLESTRTAAAWLYRVLPDLEIYNLTIQAAHGLPVSANEIWLPVSYGLGYVTVLLIAGSALFARRDLR